MGCVKCGSRHGLTLLLGKHYCHKHYMEGYQIAKKSLEDWCNPDLNAPSDDPTSKVCDSGGGGTADTEAEHEVMNSTLEAELELLRQWKETHICEFCEKQPPCASCVMIPSDFVRRE